MQVIGLELDLYELLATLLSPRNNLYNASLYNPPYKELRQQLICSCATVTLNCPIGLEAWDGV